MKYQIVGKNITVTEAISNALTKKLSKMDKYFKNDDEVVCRAVVRTYKKNEAKVEITIFSTDITFRAEVKSDDLYKAFDLAIDKLLGQMRKLKSQLKKRYDRAGVGKAIAFASSDNSMQYSFSLPLAFLHPCLKSIVPLKCFLALSFKAPSTSILTFVFLPAIM